jgi:hypothetical protein
MFVNHDRQKENKIKIPEIDLLDMKTFNCLFKYTRHGFFFPLPKLIRKKVMQVKKEEEKEKDCLFFLNFLRLFFFILLRQQ